MEGSPKKCLFSNEFQGRNLFCYAFHVCEHYIKDKKMYTTRKKSRLCEVLRFKGRKAFDDYYTTTFLDYYFRHLYTILKFIQQNDWLGEQEQYKYATFVKATLSRYEFVMLYYNGFLHPKMKKLMETYCMLSNLRSELFPLSFENSRYLQGLGINNACELTANHFSGGDFDFFLSDKEGDYLGAFYAKTELDKGKEVLELRNAYMEEKLRKKT